MYTCHHHAEHTNAAGPGARASRLLYGVALAPALALALAALAVGRVVGALGGAGSRPVRAGRGLSPSRL